MNEAQKRIYPPGAAILAPLAGHSDMPMRMSARRHGCRHAFTEMIDAGSLVFGARKSFHLIARDPSEDWLGVQLVGSETDTLGKAVEILNPLGFSVIDFNLGCPAPKVVKKGEGAALALRPDDALRAFESVVKAARVPVTAKMRIQSENDPAPTLALAKRLEDAGAATITIHGRVMKAFYSGPVHFEIIRAVRESLKIQVVANGGAFDPETFAELLEKTGCDCGMVARGSLGNPWIFREIADPRKPAPTVQELANEMEAQIKEMAAFYGEELALRAGRKVMLEYLRGRGYPGSLRASVSFIADLKAFDRLMEEVRKGPSERYWHNLETAPKSPRSLSQTP